MPWYAKPSGGYGYNSTEGRANIEQINGVLNELGFTLEAQAGILGNIVAESTLNPWRWQGDSVNMSGGYGLVQFTPARDYIDGMQNVDGYGPNLSTSSQTVGARPEDGYAQILVIANDYLSKWVSYCWRDYWSTASYPTLWAQRNRIVQQYGNGRALTLSQFKTINNVGDATLAFLACFEGPAVPNYQTRYDSAAAIYEYLSGGVTPDPPDPGPGPGPGTTVSINTVLEGNPEWVYSWHGAGQYNVGDTVIIGCVPYNQYKLVGWFDENGNLLTTGYQYSFTAETDRTFTAKVVRKQVTINTVLEGNQEWVYSWHGAGQYNVGDNVTIGCVPYNKYQLVGWFDENGNLLTTGYQYSFTAERDRTFTAVVVKKPAKAFWLKKIADANRGYKYLY